MLDVRRLAGLPVNPQMINSKSEYLNPKQANPKLQISMIQTRFFENLNFEIV
jgi:hypothetical protein